MKPPKWSHDEIDKVHDLMCEQGTQMVIKLFIEWQSQNPRSDGYERTACAIKKQIEKLQRTCQRTNHLSILKWSKVLGISRMQAYRYLKRYATRREHGYDRGVSVSEVRAVAWNNPGFLQGADVDAVREWLGQGYVKHISERATRKVRVRNVDTGEIYPSIVSAAKAVWIHKSTLSGCIRKGWRCAGYRWEKVG